MLKRDSKGRFVSSKPVEVAKVYATGFKGFEKGLICRGKQYAENTVFEEKDAVMCETGMHFCKMPLDVLGYYPPCDNNEYARVDALAPCKNGGDKNCTTKLRINTKISLAELCSAAIDFVLAKINKKKKQQVVDLVAINTGLQSATTNTGGRSAAINTGSYSVATNTGHYSVANTTGYYSVATNNGDKSVAVSTGEKSSVANTGDYSATTNTGSRSVATNTGYYSATTNTGSKSVAINTGACSAATNTGLQSVATNTGDYSAALNTGDYSAAAVYGEKAFAIATGFQGKVKGAIGCFLACAEWEQNNIDGWHPVRFISARVDGKKLKPDTWYRVKNGKFVEVKDA